MVTSKTRRLAAIVAGDAVGYSRLMDRDEKATLAALSGLMEAVVEPVVHQRGGRIFKTTGDGFLAVFGSATEATQCSLEIQHRLAAADWSIGDTAVVFRLAVHLGDVFETGEDVYGTAVNVAARLQQIADPGGVAISGDILHQLEPDFAASFTSIGVRPLKNIGQAVEVARWNPNRVAVAASGTPGTYLLPGIMTEVRRRHPDIELGVTITNSLEAWQVVMAQHADMALTGGIANLEGLADEVLTNDEIVVVGPAGGEDIMTAGDLSEETWIVREQGSASRHTAEEAMAAAALHWRSSFVLASYGSSTCRVGGRFDPLSSSCVKARFLLLPLIES